MANLNSINVIGDANIIGSLLGPFPVQDFAWKEGPISWSSAYINNWSHGGHQGSSLNGTGYATGIYINTSGYYYIHGFQRVNDASSPYIGIGLNGSRSALDTNDDVGWYHDHGNQTESFSNSYCIGYFAAGSLITCGGPISYTTLSFGASGVYGGLYMWRLK